MKKNYKYLLLLTLVSLFFCNNLFSQIDFTAITGKRWKIEQFYGNKVRYDTPSLDSVSYEYRLDHTIRVYVIGMSGYNEMNYSFQGDSLIFSANGAAETCRYKLLYLDQNNLIYGGAYIDTETQQQIDVEYRFKPED